MSITMRITKIHTSNWICKVGFLTASKMKVINATQVTPYVSKPSALGPTESPALSPVQSAMTPGLRASSSLILKTIFIKSEQMSAILVKMPPAMRRAAAPSEVEHDHDGDKNPQDHKELALGNQISFAGLVNELRDVAHGFLDGQIFQPRVNHQAENQPEHANDDSEKQELVAVNPEEADL